MRPEGPKIEAEAESGVVFLRGGSKPHQLGGLAVTKTKTNGSK